MPVERFQHIEALRYKIRILPTPHAQLRVHAYDPNWLLPCHRNIKDSECHPGCCCDIVNRCKENKEDAARARRSSTSTSTSTL